VQLPLDAAVLGIVLSFAFDAEKSSVAKTSVDAAFAIAALAGREQALS
jgi:hypothetical protein